MRSFLSRYKYQIIIFLVVLFLFFINYKKGTFLSGWDNLQTELNPLLAIRRAVFSVWEEYQSFGLLAGMAHASDLIRAIFLWVVSFILPQSIIRYFYHFLMLFLGGWGTFELFKVDSFFRRNDNNIIPLFGALFYILNLGTVQMFFLPFEPFSTFFSFLPWGIWSFYRIIDNKENKNFKKNLIQFFFINLLGTPSFYTQQLFVVYILILGLITIGLIWKINESKTKIIKNSLFSFILIFLINSFWLLPQIYFVKTSSNVVFEAKINQLATEDTYFQNKEKGTLPYFLRLEGFYFYLLDKDNNPLFFAWQNHFKKFFFLQYFFAILMILGIYYSLKNKDYLFIPSFFLLAFIFLNNTWPINLFDNFWRTNKLLNQIFRSPFTKFIIPYSLVYSYFISQGILFLKEKFFANFKILTPYYFLITTFLILYSLPSFFGFFISSEMKVKIPSDYFDVINYFKNEDKNKRIALLPEYTFWGWYQNKWGYNGSGFLWYGIEQPIVSRTFDVWSNVSESYFWEIKQAITEENLFKFEKVLEKYQIDYLILDLSLKPITGTYKGIQYDRILNLLERNQKIKLVKNGPYLRLYQVINKNQPKEFITAKTNLFNAGPKIRITDNDELFYRFGDYYINQSKTKDIYFPFLDLTSTTRIKNKKWEVFEDKDYFIIEAKTDFDIKNYYLGNFQPKYQAIIFENETLSTFSANLNWQKENNSIKVFFDKILVKKINQNEITINKNCFKNTDCLGINLPFLPQKYGYLLKINNKNLSGRRPFFYFLDQTKKHSYLEERLKDDVEYFILPESYQYGLGYSIVFHNQSYQNLKSKNQIESVEVYLLPYKNLKSLFLTSNLFYLTTDRIQDRTFETVDFKAKKISYFLYQISNFKISQNQFPATLYLSQSYHPGWKAYFSETCNVESITCKIRNIFNLFFPFIFGKEIKEHVIVNNWANGFILSLNTKLLTSNTDKFNIIIVFLPQYLEFLGFLMMGVGFLIVIKFKQQESNFD
jgi:hypothetical protein